MKTKAILGTKEVETIMAAARQEAEKNQWNVAIAVVDDGGHLLALVRLDDTAPIASSIAQEKAKSSALGRRESSQYEQMVNGGRTAFLSAPLVCSLGGGVPIVVDGQVVGAVGVSGVKADEDAQIATAGALSLNK